MNRRQFLKGLLATLATGAVMKGGIWQPEPERTVFDMGDAVAKLRNRPLIVGWDSEPCPRLRGEVFVAFGKGEWVYLGPAMWNTPYYVIDSMPPFSLTSEAPDVKVVWNWNDMEDE